jgi:hypothetical protein
MHLDCITERVRGRRPGRPPRGLRTEARPAAPGSEDGGQAGRPGVRGRSPGRPPRLLDDAAEVHRAGGYVSSGSEDEAIVVRPPRLLGDAAEVHRAGGVHLARPRDRARIDRHPGLWPMQPRCIGLGSEVGVLPVDEDDVGAGGREGAAGFDRIVEGGRRQDDDVGPLTDGQAAAVPRSG